MKQLHAVRTPLPHPDALLFDEDAFQAHTDNNGEIRGTLHRLWIEDNRVVGLWRPSTNPEDLSYIVDLAGDYNVNSTYLHEDAAYINNREDGSFYYLYSHHIMHSRGLVHQDIDTGQQELF